MPDLQLLQHNNYYVAQFTAMASPCEVLIDTGDQQTAQRLASIAKKEALRIEKKFSRYLDDNIIYQINHSHGRAVSVDDETASLLDYAHQCYQISGGLFDITSGVLRNIWKFDGSNRIAEQLQVEQQLGFVGWEKLSWERPTITLPKGMEIDFGGIGKEYAVDQSCQLLMQSSDISCLINYGGDIRVNSSRSNGQAWIIGVEDPDRLNLARANGPNLQLSRGAIATSGDSRKFILHNGIRYGHVLNPKTGWPVTRAPRSITVAADTCTEAGILSTLAILHEEHAEEFLKSEKVRYWCEW